MKSKLKFLLLSLILATTFWACKKDENKDYILGGTNPVLTASTTAINLSYANAAEPAVTFSWTNPEYRFTTGVSSQTVTYKLEIDTAGANFTNPNRQTVSVSQELGVTMTSATFNDYLLNQLQLKVGMSHNLEVRVTATLINNNVPLSSNVVKVTATPYAIPPKVQPPVNGTLWLTGDATTSGYSNPLPAPYDANQKFTMVSSTLYELTVAMKGGGAYKLIQEQGVWGTQYHMLTGGSWDGGDFEQKDSDPGFPGPPAAGNYKITVDFQRGKYTVIKL